MTPPLVLARYALADELGRGASGVVHRATDTLTGEPVAVKRVPLAGADPLRRERAALRLLALPGVVPLLDEGEHEGDAVLVMALAPGAPFPGPLPRPADVAPRAAALLAVLAAVHAHGVVHRDLKPANVRVQDGAPTVLDFGLAVGDAVGRAPTTADASGTWRYAAPEQLVGAAPDGRADVYAVGVMALEALGLDPAWLDDPPRRVAEPAPLPPLPPEAAWLGALVARDPRARPDAAEALRRAGHAPPPPAAPWRVRSAEALDGPDPEAAAVRTARAALDHGRADEAIDLLRAAALVVLPRGGLADEALHVLAEAAIRTMTPSALDRALLEVERGTLPEPRRATLAHRLRAALVAARGDGERACVLLGPPAADSEPLVWGIYVRAALNAPHRWPAVIDGLDALAVRHRAEPATTTWIDGWRGLYLYRTGDYAGAAAAHARAARHAPSDGQRLSAWLNEAAARLEHGDHPRTLAQADRARALAASLDLPVQALRARVLARAAAYRAGQVLVPARTLVDEAADAGLPDVLGYAALTEAAVAWRRRDLPDSASLRAELAATARDAYARLRLRPPWALASALAGDALTDELRAVLFGDELPLVRAQAAALLLADHPDDALRQLVRTGTAGADPAPRREVLSVAECLAAVGADPGETAP